MGFLAPFLGGKKPARLSYARLFTTPQFFTTTNSCLTSSLPDFAALAEKLHETAQAPLEFGRASQAAAHHAARAGSTPPEAASEQDEASVETRCYRLSSYILRDEQQVLARADADHWLDVLHNAYTCLHCIAHLMRQYNPEQDLRGFELNNLAETLALPLSWLDSLASTLSGFELIRHMKAE